MSSIEEKFKNSMTHYNEIDVKKIDLKCKIEKLERKRSELENIKDVLAIDNDINELKKNLDKLDNDNLENYLINVSDIVRRYGTNECNTEFKTKESHVSFGDLIKSRSVNIRGELYTKYLTVIENKPIKQTPNTNIHLFCSNCSQPWTVSQSDAIYICQNCGEHESYFETNSSGLTYEQEINTDINMNFAYKRSNHLREILAQLQAKETSNIPEHVISALRTEFKKARIDTLSEITQEKVKNYLKKLKFNRYYENTRQITNILNGKPPPAITDELYEKLLHMFMQIQEPFERACPKNRKNFFSYNYILYKFCELLDETDIMVLFPLLKSREKLYQQDCIWKKICEINEWPYYKSV